MWRLKTDRVQGRGNPPIGENGLGLSVEMASRELKTLKRLFALLPETASVFEEWERLVATHCVVVKLLMTPGSSRS